jgi:hypothetical protein
MITFKEYLVESAAGNYVSVDVYDPVIIPGLAEKFPTSKICIDEQHATLMYSETTDVPTAKINKFLVQYDEPIECKLGTVEAFDSPTAPGCCAIVVKIEGALINKIHEGLKAMGLKHSYPDFQPHVSVMYKTPLEEKEAALAYVRENLKGGTVKFLGYNVNPIDKNWADKLK